MSKRLSDFVEKLLLVLNVPLRRHMQWVDFGFYDPISDVSAHKWYDPKSGQYYLATRSNSRYRVEVPYDWSISTYYGQKQIR